METADQHGLGFTAASGALRAELETTLALQRSLLPTQLPSVPGLDLATRYLPAATEAVGGDWYDAIALPGGRIAVVVGDVVGGGRAAVAAMAQLRGALAAYALDGYPPGEVLRRLSRYAATVPGARGTTVGYAEVDPGAGTVRVASAGHPPPLLMDPAAEPRYLEVSSGPPLGAARDAPTERVFLFGEGAELVLYSDGVVERRDEPVAESMRRFAEQLTASDRPSGAQRLCDRLESWVRSSGDAGGRAAGDSDATAGVAREDDVVLLVVARTGAAPPPLRHVMPGRPGQLPHARRVLDAWLDSVGMGDDDVISVQLATGEAAANAVEHAYPDVMPDDPDRLVEITADVESGGVVRVTVSDHGQWRPPTDGDDSRGRGLTLMRQCMDSVDLDRSTTGTTVTLRRALRSPSGRSDELGYGEAGQRSAARGGGSNEERPLRLDVHPAGDRVVVSVAGEVDASNVDRLWSGLLQAVRGGARPLTLDLSGVTYLASAGVRVAFDVAELCRATGSRLAVVAPRGGVARWTAETTAISQVADLLDG